MSHQSYYSLLDFFFFKGAVDVSYLMSPLATFLVHHRYSTVIGAKTFDWVGKNRCPMSDISARYGYSLFSRRMST